MSKEAMKLALEALEKLMRFESDSWELGSCRVAGQAIKALREALAEQLAQQEPVAWMFEDDEDNGHKTFRQTPPSPEAVAYLAKWNRPAWVPLYTSPPAQRKPLTDEQIAEMMMQTWGCASIAPRHAPAFARAIEAAHGIKENT